VLKAIEIAEERTRNNTAGTIALCFNYGGQEELVDAFKKLLQDGVKPEAVTAQTIAQALYGPDVPPVDFMIRTSGEERTSGFMLYRAAYAELYFTDTFWPDFTTEDLDKALAEYARRQRRFGK
jgi:undecaprenyl diphosphate synthase